MKKEKENPNHHMGKRTGYELINGEYHLAPTYVNEFSEIARKENAISTLVNSVMDHARDDLMVIAKQKDRIFHDVIDDLGLPTSIRYCYDNGVLKEQPAEKIKEDLI